MITHLQYDRKYELVIGNTLITEPQISFKVERSLDPIPNKIELVIFNLNSETRNRLEQSKKPTLQLSAGYAQKTGVLFLGEAVSIRSHLRRPEWLTEVSGGDSESDLAESRVNLSFGPGTDFATVVVKVAESMGKVGIGNLKKAIEKATLKGSKSFKKGVTVSGPSKKELDRLLLAAGLQWSVQSGQFQILDANRTLSTTAIVLSAETGLIEALVDSDGTLEFTCLLNPDIVPGRQVVLQSRSVSGYWRCESVIYSGDRDGTDWYCRGHARLLRQ